MPKEIKIIVKTADSSLNMVIQSSSTGRQLFDKVVRLIGLREIWYFGLLYINHLGEQTWLELDKKVTSQVKQVAPLKFQLLVKYFPEDASVEIIQPLTKRLLYLQVKDSILNDEYYCPAETAVLLASYALQSAHGDYDPILHNVQSFEKENLLPPRIIKQHSLTKAEWDEQVITWYSQHKGMFKDQAIEEYLKVAQDLEQYGVTFFEIFNSKGSKLWLGVDALGINIYEHDNRLTPKIGFPWSEVNKVSYSCKKFTVKSVDPKAPAFKFQVSKSQTNQKILNLCNGNSEMFKRRRKPETAEVKQLKKEAEIEKAKRDEIRNNLLREKGLREETERSMTLMRMKVQDYEKEIALSREDFERLRLEMENKERKLREIEDMHVELENARLRAEEARILAEKAVDAEKAEKCLKERQAQETEELLHQKEEEVREREEEAKRLQVELETAKALMESQKVLLRDGGLKADEDFAVVKIENMQQQQQPPQQQQTDHIYIINHNNNDHDDSGSSNKFIFYPEANYYNTTTNNNDDDNDDDLQHKSQILLVDPSLIQREEVEKVLQVDKNAEISQKLKALREELKKTQQGNQSRNDMIYTLNQSQGRDKYKTLRELRLGNTKIRVELFESL